MRVLVTGSAGFIGFHTADILVKSGFDVVGMDVLNNYYDVRLKYSRLREHGIDADVILKDTVMCSEKYKNYKFIKTDLSDYESVVSFMQNESFDCVVHLAAQAGVRHSIEHPRDYTRNNIDGFLSVLEGCRHSKVGNLIYASTSSVYGLNTKMPFSETDPVNHPMALYAATKKANELMAHSYSHLFNLPTTGLRFFTVYGPWGRPDMALMIFADSIRQRKPIRIFNHGKMIRDFTYVTDIVESIFRLINKPADVDQTWNPDKPSPSSSSAPYRVFNIGNSNPVQLMNYLNALEDELGIEAIKCYEDMQPGDIPASLADTNSLQRYIEFKPNTDYRVGVRKFVEWYKKYYNF